MLTTSIIGMSTVAFGGLVWYVKSILSFESDTQKDVFESIPEADRETKASDLVTIGTGNKAEKVLGSEMYSGRTVVFVAGGINKTVYTLLRNYLRSDVMLEILFNPALGGNVQVSDLKSRFMTEVKTTNQITGDGMTLFNIDGDTVFMLRNGNNAIIRVEGSTKDEATYHNRDMWAGATRYD